MSNHTRKLRTEQLEKREMLAADMGALSGNFQDFHKLFDELTVEVAAIDGSGNNPLITDWGSTESQLLRIVSVEYGDGVVTPAGEELPSAREVSNAISAQSDSVTNDRLLTDMVWLWGQFIDHDLDLTGSADPLESFDIVVPTGDAFFDPTGTGEETIALNRSYYDHTTGNETGDSRQQINQITAFLDGSVVYGSDEARAAALRTFAGGKLKTSEGDLLPFNSDGFDNAGGPSDSLFLAGDVRVNENAALTAMQTLWVREHNRLAEQFAADDPSLSDEDLYQKARAIVRAEIQAITYNEFLPALLGQRALSQYSGYDPTVNPEISNLFSTAAYRFGHSMLSSELLRLNNDGSVVDEGNLELRDAFFAPQQIVEGGIDSLLLGVTNQVAQEIDTLVIDDVRNFLFGEPGQGGFDLVSLNIQRGRDHGLADYNQARIDLGLSPVTSFDQITSNAALAHELEQVYGSVDNLDAWVGGLAEDHVRGSSVGELVQTVLVDQFERLRTGDRFWYQNIFSGRELDAIENTSLADVIMRNTDIVDLDQNVFSERSEHGPQPVGHGHPRHPHFHPMPPMTATPAHRLQPPLHPVADGTNTVSDQSERPEPAPRPESSSRQMSRRDERARNRISDPAEVVDTPFSSDLADLAALDMAMSQMRFGRGR